VSSGGGDQDCGGHEIEYADKGEQWREADHVGRLSDRERE
jgi:hypothetical protein